MALKAVKTPDLQVAEQSVAAQPVTSKSGKDRYDLATAIGIVREMETSAGRAAVFEEIKRKNAIYRLVDTLYTKAGTRLVQPLLLFVYILKCVVSIGPFDDEAAEAVSLANFENEHKTIARITALVPDANILNLSIERKHAFAFEQIKAAFRMLGSAKRMWSFLRILVRTHSFMPAARIASALAFYMRFAQMFADRPRLNAAIVASNYSPEAVGMAAAAHRMGRKLVYSNHAPVPANGPVVPPVYADCALFYGDETRQTYKRRSAITSEVAFIGQPGTARRMEWRDEVETVGIFLTSGTKVDVLKSLIATIRVTLPKAHILIRQHPVQLLKTDFSGLELTDSSIELTIGNPLDDEIAACDLVICGNSGVAMNVLSGGRPVAYLSSLDGIIFDSNGFVASRLVYNMPWWSDDLYDRLSGFYQAPGWQGVMQSYDASYGRDVSELHREAARTVLRHLRPSAERPSHDLSLKAANSPG